MPLKGKTALITGSSRGIGRGIALKLAAQGVKTCITYYTKTDAADETLAKVRACGSDGFVVQADVTKPEEIRRLFDRVKQEFGTLDILVSNARPELAAFYTKPMDLTLEQWHRALDSQAQAFLLEVQMAAPLMPDGGRIIAISYSPSGLTGSWQPWVAMGAAKAAQDSLARYFAVALGRRGITVNVISPGATEDSVVGRLPTEVFQAIKTWHESGWTPIGRLATPADIGNAVVLFCMDEASFITGQTLHVDGGGSVMDPVFPLEIQRG
jgi:NAD(P)-dependent dehydrogenase (short-subunit alcohol dehydrogenase family)